MTITVPLTKEEEQRLAELAEDRGLSPDALVQTAVKQLLETGMPSANDAQLSTEARERQVDELFASFDSVEMGPDVNEAAFHRENWYR